MIVVRTPEHPLFNYTECRELFEQHKEIDVDDFDTILKTTHFFEFYDWNKHELIGCIYYYREKGKLCVSAYANRGHHELNLECFKRSLTWYKTNIYAYCKVKTARLCLLKCGFEKISKNLFVYRRKKHGQR